MDWIMWVSCGIFFIIRVFLYIIDPDNNKKETFLGKVWETICCLFVSTLGGLFLGGLCGGLIHFIGRCSLEKEEKVTQSYDLVALDTNEDINGHYNSLFFVGSGHIGEDNYYHFYYNTPNGIRYKKVLAERCYIIETKEKPSYKFYGTYYKKSKSVFYTNDIINETKKVLYIPKGTIKSNYKLN